MHKHRILVVEDNRDAQRILEIALRREGFEFFMTTTVQEATSVGMGEHFDLLICDIGLPDGDGTEVLRVLRTRRSFPAIALTAFTSVQDIERQVIAGFDLHLAKPFTISSLRDSIHKLLALYGLATAVS